MYQKQLGQRNMSKGERGTNTSFKIDGMTHRYTLKKKTPLNVFQIQLLTISTPTARWNHGEMVKPTSGITHIMDDRPLSLA